MSKKKFYAVKVGRKTGIFTTWAECLASVSGYSKAKFKGFETKEDAEAYMNNLTVKKKKVKDIIKSIHESEDDKTIYYAVKEGRKIGLYSTWEECKEQINGYSGAEYKKVKGKIAALKYINPNLIVKSDKKASSKTKSKTVVKKGYDVKPIKSTAKVKRTGEFIDPKVIKEKYEFVAFVDGSYDRFTKTYGSGVIVLRDNDLYDTYSKSGYDKWDQWNIVGELEATKLAIKKAREEGAKNIAIYHDLKNISLWAAGEWKAKNEYTQEYVRFIEKASKELNIYFIKVKGHSDDFYNDLADEAAKKAIFIK